MNAKARQELRDRLLGAIRDAARECERTRRWVLALIAGIVGAIVTLIGALR